MPDTSPWPPSAVRAALEAWEVHGQAGASPEECMRAALTAAAGDITADDMPTLIAATVGIDGYLSPERLEATQRRLADPIHCGYPGLWPTYVLGARDGLRAMIENRAGLAEEAEFCRANPTALWEAVGRSGDPSSS